MSTKLYHRDIGIPKVPAIEKLCGQQWLLHYTGHAMRECVHDNHGIIRMPPHHLRFSFRDIVEAERDNVGNIEKLVVRIPYDDNRDIVLVLVGFEPGVGECRVSSVWTNLKHDTHVTLDKSKYCHA